MQEAAVAPNEEVRHDDVESPWGHLVDKISQTALVLVLTKLVSAWIVIAFWGVELQSRLLWGFVPYAGLQTSGAQFRTVAAWSTAIAAVAAVVWTAVHFIRRHRAHPARAWGAAAAIPMAGLLTFFEWMRRFDADHLIPTSWLVRITIFLAVAAVLFLGFIEFPGDDTEETTKEKQRTALPRITPQA